MELHDEHVVDWCYHTTDVYTDNYVAGEVAYGNGISFDAKQSDAWQRGWIDAKADEQTWEFDQGCPEMD